MNQSKLIKLRISIDDLAYMAALRDELGMTSFAQVQKHLLKQHKQRRDDD